MAPSGLDDSLLLVGGKFLQKVGHELASTSKLHSVSWGVPKVERVPGKDQE